MFRWRSAVVVTAGTVVAMLLAPVWDARTAEACSFAINQHQLDPAEQALDTQPPSTPVVGNLKIKRGQGSEGTGCSSSASSCDDIGTVTFATSAIDDRTPPLTMGYRFSISRGQAPSGLITTGVDLRASNGMIILLWSDGASDSQEDLDFDIEVRAIDLAGNLSAQAATVSIHDSPGGCHLAGRGPRSGRSMALVGTVVFAVGLLLRRRRRPPVASAGRGAAAR